MQYIPEYGAQTARQVTDADLLAALLPTSPADLVQPQAAPAPAPVGIPTVAYLPGGQPVYVPIPIQTPAPVEAGPLVPRWAVGTAVAAVGVGGGAVLLGVALDLIGSATAALAAGLTAIAGPLLLAATAVVAIWMARGGRRGGHDQVSITQTVTQTVRIIGGGK